MNSVWVLSSAEVSAALRLISDVEIEETKAAARIRNPHGAAGKKK
jgi:hypothetical protein